MRKSNILALVKQSIADKEMNIVVGGAFKSCECACIYENQGGASTADNAVANYENNYESSKGCNRIIKSDDGYGVVIVNEKG